MLFVCLLKLYYYFYCSRFYSIYLLYHFAGMRFYLFIFFKLFGIYVLNILEYMNRQQQPGKTALICSRDAYIHTRFVEKESVAVAITCSSLKRPQNSTCTFKYSLFLLSSFVTSIRSWRLANLCGVQMHV